MEVSMKTFKKAISIMMVAAVLVAMIAIGTISSGASGTGVGLAEWALNAYYSGWDYVYGGSTPGAVDCSGLIYSYAGGYRGGNDQTFNSDYRGYTSDGVPNIHGLGLYSPGHVGVYVGNGMAVDARGDAYGVCYESVWSHGWTQYFKVPGVSYPTTGWVEFNGDYYYYEDGEYLADTTRTIDGTNYTFTSSGKSSKGGAGSSSSSSSSSTSTSTSTAAASTDSGALKNGSTGDKVEKLQARLQELGYYTGSVDGSFGSGTEEAFKLFQKTAGLYVDGIAGSDADYLFSDNAPSYKTETSTETAAETPAETKLEKTELAGTGVGESTAAAAAETADTADTGIKLEKGDYSDDVALTQLKLIELGYLSGEADGEYGAATEAAVKNFQTANNLTATGVVEQSTYDAIFSDSAVKNTAEASAAPAAASAASDTLAKADAQQTQSAGPAAAAGMVSKPAADAAKTPKTDVEKNTAELSSKSVAAVADSPIFKRSANATNFEFIIWLVVMIVVMLVTFSIVYVIEKKKQRNAYSARRFQTQA